MGKALVIAAALLLAGLAGTVMLAGYDAVRGSGASRSECQVIQARLATLKGLLLAYKARHGRYPTTEEGLQALDTFAARFPYRLGGVDEGPGARRFLLQRLPGILAPGQSLGVSRPNLVGLYAAKYGRVPRDANEFDEAIDYRLGFHGGGNDGGTSDGSDAEIAMDAEGAVFPITAAGVLSPWLVPYVYENRNGVPPAAFAGSPVDGDWLGRYSLKVDEGVYLACVGAQARAEELNGSRVVGLVVLAAGLGLAVLAYWGMRGGFHSLPGRAVATIVAAAGGIFWTQATTLCYAPIRMFEGRSTVIAARRVELLEKHRAGGAIGDAAYQKALAAMRLMDPDLAPKPAAPVSRPSGE